MSAIRLYSQYATQWRTGSGGAFGLDFNVFHHALDRMELNPDRYEDILSDLRIIEDVALTIVNKE